MKYINLENKFNVNLGKMKAEDDIFINCEMKEEIKTELDPEFFPPPPCLLLFCTWI